MRENPKTTIYPFQGDESGYKHRTEVGNAQIRRSANRNGNAGRDPIRLAPLSPSALRQEEGARLAPIQSRKLSVTKVSAKKAGMTFLPLLCHFGSLVPLRAIKCQSAMLVHNSISETPALNDSHHVINEAKKGTKVMTSTLRRGWVF